jgi:putative SOS response-associated peptidase YedK
MCYDKSYLSQKIERYAKRYANSPEEEEFVKKQISDLNITPTHYVNGYVHPLAPVITNEDPKLIQAFSWGLIPSWSKDAFSAVKISNQCLNARGETIFDKPAFRSAATRRRCLVICVDGFFEYYHYAKSTYPHFIKLKNNEPMTFAGLWERWENIEQGLVMHTYTIVTTTANKFMQKIHNNPKREGAESRMPVILPKALERDWLKPINDKADKELLQQLLLPYPVDLMEAYPVRQLKGKHGIGNVPEANEPFDYPELALDI